MILKKEKIIEGISTAVIAVSIAVMIGWFFDIDPLKSLIPGFMTMKFTTAFSFFLGGLILYFAVRNEKEDNPWASIFLPTATLTISILAGVGLVSSLLGFKNGLESLFLRETSEAILTSARENPSMGTIFGFLSISALGIIAISKIKTRKKIYITLGSLILLIGSVALLGYLISEEMLYYAMPGISKAMTVQAASLFIVLGVGFVLLGRGGKKSPPGKTKEKRSPKK